MPTDPLLRDVMAYATTQSWETARDILANNSAKLLSDRAEQLLHSTVVSMQFLGTGNPTAGALLREREAFLQRARAIGIAAAWAERHPTQAAAAATATDPLALPGLVGNWLDTRTYADQRAFLASHLALLDPLTDRIMTTLIVQFQGKDNEQFLHASLVWLQTARASGLDAGWRAFCQEMGIPADPAEAERLLQLVLDWLNSQTFGEMYDFLKGHPELLKPQADSILEALAAQYAGQKEEKLLRASQLWLQRSRQDGMEAGWQAFQLALLYDQPQSI
jgi:hypothetical protein